MATDSIVWGETYDISVTAKDANGDAIAIDGTWEAAIRIVRDRIGGPEIESGAMTIADNAATYSIDTGKAPWTADTYVYDIRLTDPDGNDYWCEPIELTLSDRVTLPSS